MPTDAQPTKVKKPFVSFFGELVRVDPSIAVFRGLAISVTDVKDLPYDLEMKAVLEDGRYVVQELCCHRKADGPPVTGEGLRSLPVSRLLGLACADAMMEVEKTGEGTVRMSPRRSAPEDVASHGPTDEALRFVAQAYRYALLVDEAPIKVVMNSLGLPRSTAGRWVMKARQRGFLGPAEERRPGERRG